MTRLQFELHVTRERRPAWGGGAALALAVVVVSVAMALAPLVVGWGL